jgi:hypothetical protein
MLRGNLSSRPFYNEGLVSAALVVIGVVALALTAFNASELVALSSERSALVAAVRNDEAQADRIRADASALQKSVDRSTLTLLAGATREANTLIDERTFSWTVFFGLLEKTLPTDVRLIAVAPMIENGQVKVSMRVGARRVEDLRVFVEALQDSGAFYDILPHSQERNDDGTFAANLQAFYLAPGQVPGKPAKTKTGGRGRL